MNIKSGFGDLKFNQRGFGKYRITRMNLTHTTLNEVEQNTNNLENGTRQLQTYTNTPQILSQILNRTKTAIEQITGTDFTQNPSTNLVNIASSIGPFWDSQVQYKFRYSTVSGGGTNHCVVGKYIYRSYETRYNMETGQDEQLTWYTNYTSFSAPAVNKIRKEIYWIAKKISDNKWYVLRHTESMSPSSVYARQMSDQTVFTSIPTKAVATRDWIYFWLDISRYLIAIASQNLSTQYYTNIYCTEISNFVVSPPNMFSNTEYVYFQINTGSGFRLYKASGGSLSNIESFGGAKGLFWYANHLIACGSGSCLRIDPGTGNPLSDTIINSEIDSVYDFLFQPPWWLFVLQYAPESKLAVYDARTMKSAMKIVFSIVGRKIFRIDKSTIFFPTNSYWHFIYLDNSWNGTGGI